MTYHYVMKVDKRKTACGRTIREGMSVFTDPAQEVPPQEICKRCARSRLAKIPRGAMSKKPERKGRTPALAIYPNRPTELVVTYKGVPYQATVNEDGTITVNGKLFTSPSRAGKEITGKEVDGWTFWSYEVPGVGFKKLDTLRKERG